MGENSKKTEKMITARSSKPSEEEKKKLNEIKLKFMESRYSCPCCKRAKRLRISSDDEEGGTVFVSGFDCSLTEDDIKIALIEHFSSSSCGEVTRVYFPRNSVTGARENFAYVDLKIGRDKALKLSGSRMTARGWNLEVREAVLQDKHRAN